MPKLNLDLHTLLILLEFSHKDGSGNILGLIFIAEICAKNTGTVSGGDWKRFTFFYSPTNLEICLPGLSTFFSSASKYTDILVYWLPAC